MRYALLGTVAAAALSLSVAAIAGGASTGGQSTGGSGAREAGNPSGASTTVTTTPGTTGAVTFAPEQRTIIRQRLTTARPVQIRERVTVGTTVPSDVELVEIPQAVVTEVPTVRSYRYFRYNDDVVLVDPSSRRVVHVID